MLGLRFLKFEISFQMKAFYSDRFVLPLPSGHRFPMKKYFILRQRVQAELPDVELNEAQITADSDLGCLALSMDGLAKRDSMVIGAAIERGLPVAIAMVGGYGRDIDVTVDVHLQTIQLAAVASGEDKARSRWTYRPARFI
jgi:hypothetical protein